MTKRYRCRTCKRSFRVHPQGGPRASFSQRVKAIAVMLYLSGLSYTAVALVMEQLLDITMSKTEVYYILQQCAQVVHQHQQQRLLEARTQAIGSDVTTVQCAGKPVR
jgi:transposase-like protein